jgi:hypothetical protein
MNTVFIVADGLNTSYIDSLLTGLFYKQTHLQEMLIQLPENIKFAYLQDLINNNFVDPIRHNFSVDSTLINEIRNYSIICGWKEGYNITDLYNVTDFLDFLITGINFGMMNYEIIEIQKSTPQEEKSKLLQMNYIQINAGSDSDIETLLQKWIDTILLEQISNNIEAYYHFKELPMLVSIYLNRTTDNKQINNCSIDIKKRIKFYKNNDKTQLTASWIIHAIICYSGSGGGKYYTLINQSNNYIKSDMSTDLRNVSHNFSHKDSDANMIWYMYNNDKIPSMVKIDIKNKDISLKIKQECVLVMYRLDDNLI